MCQLPALPGKKRCRLHGGLSTGPKTPEGKAISSANSLKDGKFSKAARDRRARRSGRRHRSSAGSFMTLIEQMARELALDFVNKYWVDP